MVDMLLNATREFFAPLPSYHVSVAGKPPMIIKAANPNIAKRAFCKSYGFKRTRTGITVKELA